MKPKLVFSTETKDTEQWTYLPFIPRMHEWVNVINVLNPDEIEKTKHSAKCRSGTSIHSRLHEQFNLIAFSESAKDKRV